ncbi:MAG: hypothetical protein PVI06_01210 [Desulfobacterales bacterium]|jgi:hypothetical protein
MSPKNIKPLILTIGLGMALTAAAIWLLVARLDRIIDNPVRRTSNHRQFFIPSKPLKPWDYLGNPLHSKNNKTVSHSKFLPKSKNSESLPMSRQNENSAQNEIFGVVVSSLREGFPELDLSEAEVIELSEIVMEIRESIQGLRRIERKDENIELFRELEAQRDQALLDFERITGMSVVEFLRRAPSKGRVTYDDDPQAPVKFKYLHNFRP